MQKASGKFQFLQIEKKESDAIWVVAINNPPVNVLSSGILDELDNCIADFQTCASAKSLILTGSGERAFCAGADINEIASIANPDMGGKLAQKGQNLCERIEKCDKPIIAAVHALCLGGGNELILACHMRIASERAKFGQPEITIGIIPGFGGTQRLPRLIGASRARKLILTGDTIAAAEAYTLGLVDEVVKHGVAVDRSIEIAKRVVKNSMKMVQLSQEAIREGLKLSLDKGIEKELECFLEVCRSEDMKEGLKAFREKRQPKYKDR
ncbi:MAG: enoyl-CoA hydratase-related protein [Chlamydiota bacterium]|nr:enoyl-CoA hydratase-related protein [Chlamydiota bacterium]